jgi:hypothetical protein
MSRAAMLYATGSRPKPSSSSWKIPRSIGPSRPRFSRSTCRAGVRPAPRLALLATSPGSLVGARWCRRFLRYRRSSADEHHGRAGSAPLASVFPDRVRFVNWGSSSYCEYLVRHFCEWIRCGRLADRGRYQVAGRQAVFTKRTRFLFPPALTSGQTEVVVD